MLIADAGEVLAAVIWLGLALSLGYVAYRSCLGLLGLKRQRGYPLGDGKNLFLVLVPAHNESYVIGETVSCMSALDYPKDRTRIIVVADDCSDGTEEVARAAGATVLLKPGPASNKGDVLQWALARPDILNAAWDALVVFDADSRPQANFLRLMDGALAMGAKALQGRRESGDQQGWIARGYAVNNVARNRLWHLSREAAGFSGALTGAGICLSREVLRAVPPTTSTLTEDLEYSAKLTREGVRVHYVHDAVIQIEQPANLGSSVRQRVRWARGQLKTALAYGPALIWKALRKADFSAMDAALYLAMPSLVPLQALLLFWAAGSLLLGGMWPDARIPGLPGIPTALVLVVLAISFALPYVSFQAERRKADVRDWAAFLLLMLTWIPVAVFAAVTAWVQSWHRTPHGSPQTGPEFPPQAIASEDDDLRPVVP